MTFRARVVPLFAAPALLLAGCTSAPMSVSSMLERQAELQARGYLREDRGAGIAITREALIRNFRDIAFFYEFHFVNGAPVNEPIEKPLKRWRGTIRYRLLGDGVDTAFRADVRDLVARLGTLTGLRFVPVAGFTASVQNRSVDQDDDRIRDALTGGSEVGPPASQENKPHDLLISIAGPLGRAAVSRHLAEQDLPVYRRRYGLWHRQATFTCAATVSSDRNESARLVFAHVYIAAELPDAMRRSCLDEEIAQVLGLTNDSDQARPSIFNDDEEFAVLTDHDALLLRALYDPRLRPGMSADEAMPIALVILDELLAERRDRASDAPVRTEPSG